MSSWSTSWTRQRLTNPWTNIRKSFFICLQFMLLLHIRGKNVCLYQKANFRCVLLCIVKDHILLNSITCWGPRQAGQAQGFPLLHTASLAAFPRPRNKSCRPPTYPTRTHKHTSKDLTLYIFVNSCLFSHHSFKLHPPSSPLPHSGLSATHWVLILVLFSQWVLPY